MKLWIRKAQTQEFERTKCEGTYQDLIKLGQETAGYGNFYVETDHAPSREQQLLQVKPTKLQTKLAQLL